AWGAFSQTPTFQALPEAVKTRVTRRGLGRILNILQVGESVAQDVCAKIALRVREEDYRNHAVAQAMDEARHHLAYRRFIEKMNEEPEDIDLGTEMMFDTLLASDDPLVLIATEQFFLESLAMGIFEGIQRHARHPLLRDIITFVTRDESRHMGFGILYVSEWMRQHSLDQQIAFARRWLGQILGVVMDQPGPLMLSRIVQRMREAGVDNADQLGARMLREQQPINAAEAAEAIAGRHVPHLLKSARRAGLLKAEIVEALGVATHPLIVGALRHATDTDAAA
ncbi:MAG: ferritin-like domain-containing protein, partial [Gaiellaceae bacterium]